MSSRQELGAWLLVAAGFVLFVVTFEAILLPFVAGIAIGYFLDPLADRLQRLRLPRAIAALVVLVGFFLLMIGVLLLLVPLLQAQILELARRLPDYLGLLQERLIAAVELVETRLAPEDIARLREALSAQAGAVFGWAAGMLSGIVGSGLAIFNLLALLFVTPVVAFYMLRDWDRLVAQLDRLLPRPHAETVREQARRVDATLAGFVRGQAMVCVLLGLFYGGALTIAGLDFGFTIGLVAGLVSFIPYVGSVFGLVSSVGLAFVQFDELGRVLVVAVIFVVGQAVEGNLLTPKLVGDRVGLHPVWVIFALFAGGALFGFVGMLIALPVAAVVGVLIRFGIDRYLHSPLYQPAPVLPAGPEKSKAGDPGWPRS